MTLSGLNAGDVRRWYAVALHGLVAHRAEIDELNVYPVPDGDTGTNLVLTMESVAGALAECPDGDLAVTVDAAARGALMGARGNSGVILSQLLRGIAEVFSTCESVTAADVQHALTRAADLAYAAVAEPVEGTILTVARAAADAAAVDGDLATVVAAAVRGADAALARTTDQLAALKQAGVVDAGGRGYCVVLEALDQVVTGRTASAPAPVVARDRSALVVAREAGSAEFGYEVQYLLTATPDAIEPLKKSLADLGDSLVVVGGDDLWNVHVHVNDVGAAVEAGIEAGRPHRIAVTRFADQMAAVPDAREAAMAGVLGNQQHEPAPGERAVVAVVPGGGLAVLFRESGAQVVGGGPTANPSTREILDAILASRAAQVIVLPNDGNAHGAAAAAAAEAAQSGVQVHVVPTRSPVQGLAALAVHDPGRAFADDAIGMTTAAGATRWAEVTVAVREAQTSAGRCQAGDVLGLIDGDVAVIGDDVRAVGLEVIDRMLVSGGELVTVVSGAEAPAGLADDIAAVVGATHPMVDVDHHEGGQPHYPLLLGVE